jgi:hypothetical protein
MHKIFEFISHVNLLMRGAVPQAFFISLQSISLASFIAEMVTGGLREDYVVTRRRGCCCCDEEESMLL